MRKKRLQNKLREIFSLTRAACNARALPFTLDALLALSSFASVLSLSDFACKTFDFASKIGERKSKQRIEAMHNEYSCLGQKV